MKSFFSVKKLNEGVEERGFHIFEFRGKGKVKTKRFGFCRAVPGEHVGIMSSRESFLEFLQLEAGEGSPISALFPFRCKVVDLGLAFRAGRRCSRVVALFLGSHFFRRDSHLSRLRRCRSRWRSLLVSLLAHLL